MGEGLRDRYARQGYPVYSVRGRGEMAAWWAFRTRSRCDSGPRQRTAGEPRMLACTESGGTFRLSGACSGWLASIAALSNSRATHPSLSRILMLPGGTHRHASNYPPPIITVTVLATLPSTVSTTFTSPRPIRLRGSRTLIWSSPTNSGCSPA